ncbi:4-(cytidine 5'-diphospho)-2-C-methyl-D-erythritol kinase [Aquaspirillum sp. LM1]|uniref:4-(cytidine 5'-diphospho)-2-C-methyl-D-erythritol kinase n=1 Tax=Aquaspirillum sp. LM1 TaxID=1938604 RepID=UPI0015C57976|nr:4-(cytidine 5'-diphospho)-2-C-methyl-D-erythritol kinase [Aquaspirillum sp. LM1]
MAIISPFQSFPAPAKLNLTLAITGRRADGYHLLESVFRFIDLMDTVELAVRDDGQMVLDTPIAGVPADTDLTVRAARALQAASGSTLGASIRLHKRIPMGGGLGGGSSDAATVLLALNRLWQLNLPRQALQDIGVTLGADVPVFIFGRPAFATGIGDELTECDVPDAWYVVLHPGVSVPTAKIFSHQGLTRNSTPSIMRALQTTQRKNDMQSVVCQMFPEVADCLAKASEYGSAMMTGSGACVFLEYDAEAQAGAVFQSLSHSYTGFMARGLQHHPLYDGR